MKAPFSKASNCLVSKYIGSDFDKVSTVSDNIQEVVTVADNIDDITDLISHLPEISDIPLAVKQAEDAAAAAEVSETNAKTSENAAKISEDNAEAFAKIVADHITYMPNLLQNPNFEIAAPNVVLDTTPRDFVANEPLRDGWITAEDCTGVTYIDGEISLATGSYYQDVLRAGTTLQYITDFTASIKSANGTPSTTGVSWGIVGVYFRVTVSASSVFSVCFNEGDFAASHAADNQINEYGNPSVTKVIDLRWFGISGETNNTEFGKVQSYIESLPSGSSVHIKSGGDLHLTSKGTYLSLSNLKSIKWDDLVIIDTNTYSGAFDITRLLDLTNIDIVDITVNAASTLTSVGGDKQGLTIARLDTSKNLTFNGVISKLYQGIEYKNVDLANINTVNNDTRYPFLATGGNGIINANLVNNGCRRDIFIQNGCNGGLIKIDSTDIEEASIIAHYIQSDSDDIKTRNLDIYYTSKSSGRYDSTRGDRAPPLNIQIDTKTGITSGKSEVRDINIQYNIEDAKWGGVLGLRKTIDNFNPDTVGRGYVLTNIKVSGRIELGSDNDCVYFNYNTGKNWYSGDQISGIYLDKLTVLDRSPAQIEFNVNILEDALTSGGLVVIDHNAPSVVINNSINFEDKVIFKRCEFLNYTTRDTQPLSRTTLFRKGWAKINNGEIVIAKVDPYRTVTSVNIYIDLYTPDTTSATKAISGKFSGNILYASSPNFGFDGTFITEFSKGGTLNPVLIGDSEGNVSISIPELSAVTGTQLCIDASLCYNQYSGGDNDNIRGMVSKDFALVF